MKKAVNRFAAGCVLIPFISLSALAASSFQEKEACGKAAVVAGDTCSNVKVEFNLADCDQTLGTKAAEKITCVEQTIKARWQEGDTRFEAQFEKVSDKWGAVAWKPLGGVKHFEKTSKKSVAHAPATPHHSTPAPITHFAAPTPERNVAVEASKPAAEPLMPKPPEPVTPASPFKFGGFADLRYSDYSVRDKPGVVNGIPESGFGIEDGAFYANYDREKLSVVLDVAFRRAKDTDTNAAATAGQSSNSNIAIGVDRSQLYLKYRPVANMAVNFGQFDTIFGVELNDSKDRVFGKTGIVYDYTLPVTHTGLMLEYTMAGFYAKVFGANPNNKGSYGSTTTAEDRTEYGLALGFSNDMYRAQLGGMTRPIMKGNFQQGDRRLLDAIVGTTMGAFSLDFEFASVNDPSKNTLTPADSTDSENPGNASMLLASYKINDAYMVGARYEQAVNDPSAGSIRNTVTSGLSLQYKVDPNLQLRTEYTRYNVKNLSDVSWIESRFNFAALLLF